MKLYKHFFYTNDRHKTGMSLVWWSHIQNTGNKILTLLNMWKKGLKALKVGGWMMFQWKRILISWIPHLENLYWDVQVSIQALTPLINAAILEMICNIYSGEYNILYSPNKATKNSTKILSCNFCICKDVKGYECVGIIEKLRKLLPINTL